MARTHDTERDEEFQHGYQAAQAGQVDFRHSRYWIDDRTGAELCRPGVVAGIVAAQRDAAELASVLEAEYRDEMDTRRSACDWAVQ